MKVYRTLKAGAVVLLSGALTLGMPLAAIAEELATTAQTEDAIELQQEAENVVEAVDEQAEAQETTEQEEASAEAESEVVVEEAKEAAVDVEEGAEESLALGATQDKNLTIGASNVKGSITSTYRRVRYKFTTTKSGVVKVWGSVNTTGEAYVYLYDQYFKQLYGTPRLFMPQDEDLSKSYYLSAGTYYLSFESIGSYTATFSFSTSFTDAKESFAEPTSGNNNSASAASSISLDKSYRAFISPTDDTDYFKVNVNKAGTYAFTTTHVDKPSSGACVWSTIINSSNKEVWSNRGHGLGSANVKLEKGTYYIKIWAAVSKPTFDCGTVEFKLTSPKTTTKPTTTKVTKVTMYRLYNPNSGEHFYTSSTKERDSIKKSGWRYEGIAWTAPKSSKTPVYRLYSGTDHHYTTSTSERDSLRRAGWKYEGIGWYSDDSKGVPLYRQFNPNVQPTAPRNNSGSHNYTTSKKENDNLVKVGWRAEGIGWYGVK